MDNHEMKISMSITPTWSLLNEVKEKIEKFMVEKKASQDIIDATIMCSAELMENAIKYGPAGRNEVKINFDLNFSHGMICIAVTNDVKNIEDVQNVKQHIEKLKNSGDAGTLYVERLSQLMDNPKIGISQLGLYRIAYEGEFKLDYGYEKNILTVVAERKL